MNKTFIAIELVSLLPENFTVPVLTARRALENVFVPGPRSLRQLVAASLAKILTVTPDHKPTRPDLAAPHALERMRPGSSLLRAARLAVFFLVPDDDLMRGETLAARLADGLVFNDTFLSRLA